MPSYKEGIYKVEIVGQGLNVSKTKGTPGFFLRIIPEGGMYERDIQWYLTDKTIEYFVRDMKKLGFTGTSPSQLDPEAEGHHSFVGMEIEATCSYEENNGKVYERWGLPFESKPREVVSMDRKAARRLDALFGKQFKDAFGTGARTQQQPPQATQEAAPLTPANMAAETAKAEEDDDAIPF